jgi:hypothetical protein
VVVPTLLLALFTEVPRTGILGSSPLEQGSKRPNQQPKAPYPRQKFEGLLPCYAPLLRENFSA